LITFTSGFSVIPSPIQNLNIKTYRTIIFPVEGVYVWKHRAKENVWTWQKGSNTENG